MKKLESEFQYYLDHQEELLKQYNGRFIVIKDCQVHGAYNSELEAVNEASRQFKLGTFLVQKCEPGIESYTQTYHSRVVFV